MSLAKAVATPILETQIEDNEGADPDKNAALRAIQRELRKRWNSMDGNALCRYILLYRWVDSGSWGPHRFELSPRFLSA